MKMSKNSGSFDIVFDADGYSQHLGFSDVENYAVQVTGNDGYNWKMEATIGDSGFWYVLTDTDSDTTKHVDTAPRKYDVSKYTRGRIYVNGVGAVYGSYRAHVKGSSS
jgi:hypothetical protein